MKKDTLGSEELKLEREVLEPILENTTSLNDLDTPMVLSFLKIDQKDPKAQDAAIETCMGDIYEIVNMLMDYARILEAAVEQWKMTAHRMDKGAGGRRPPQSPPGEEALILATRPKQAKEGEENLI